MNTQCTRVRVIELGCLAAVVVLAFASFANGARAEDMSFTIEETGAVQPPEGPPSTVLREALSAYQRQQYDEAMIKFKRVADRKTKEAKGNAHKAEFFLGKSLYHSRFYQSALSVFDAISAAGPKHRYFGETLQWLALLASQLPEGSGIIEKVGRYGVGAIGDFKGRSGTLYAQLQYLMGRHLYAQGEFQDAIELLREVPKGSAQYTKARFFEGIAYIRMRKARPAISAFRAILDELDSGDANVVDEDRMRNLAWISLARVYYTAANQRDAATGGVDVDGTLLGQSVEAWTSVEQSSEYWLDAVFESSWAFFLADEYSRALGNVHTLNSPFFKEAFYPEALVLKAVTFFVNCQVDNAEAVVTQFHERYDPVKAELDAVLAKHGDNAEFFSFVEKVRADEAEVSPQVRGMISSALSDRTVVRNLEYVALLDAEQERLGEQSKRFQDSDVGGQILQDVALARAFAVDQAGDLARARYNRLIRELKDLSNQVDTVELEIATYQRGQIDQELQQQMAQARESGGGNVNVDEEHQLWPFDGEYWRDELGFYRQQVTNQCTR